MACREYEDRIMEMQEGTLPVADRGAVEDHMAACEACRRYSQRLQGLDDAMTAVCRIADLAPDFKARLMQRIDLESAHRPVLTLQARKDQAEHEYITMMADLLHTVRRSTLFWLLDVVGLITVTIIAVFGLRSILGPLPSPDVIGRLVVQCTTGYLVWVWAVACLAAGLGIAFGRQFLARVARL
jgi:anti-sigma factor RsiW